MSQALTLRRAKDGFTAATERRAAGLTAGLTSLGFIGAVLRRRVWVWGATAMAGLAVGVGLYVMAPPAYQASTSVLLTNSPNESPADAVQDSVALAQSPTVVNLVLHKLGLRQSARSFSTAYSVTPITERIFVITVSATSSSDAVLRANALAAQFLQFRADQLTIQRQLTLTALDQEITAAEQSIASVGRQITAEAALPVSPDQQSTLRALKSERSNKIRSLTDLEQYVIGYPATVASAIDSSQVLDPAAPLPRSHLKVPALYLGGGLIAGLTLGLGIVIVGALASDRLLLRDDVARALGVPVRLSVGRLRGGRRLLGRRGVAANRGQAARNTRCIVAHLRSAVPASSRGPAALAVVAVDNAQVVARSLVSLAVLCAQEGRRVVLADLSGGSPAARLLRAGSPGVRAVSRDGASLIVAVPDRGVMPVGPLRLGLPETQPGAEAEALATACDSADLMLTLVTLDPGLGAEHLATWATGAVVVVTAGRSSSTRIHAVGEMIRLAGTSLISAVLIGADKNDEGLGVPRKQQARFRPTRRPSAATA